MGWYHYQFAEDGSPDLSHPPVPCPDGTCASAASVVAVPQDGAGNTHSEEEEEIYHADSPIYHLCQKKLWLQAVAHSKEEPYSYYFPPTFKADGKFTRASCQAETLLETANHYYADTSSSTTSRSIEWICLELDPVEWRRKLGVVMVAQRERTTTTTSSSSKEDNEKEPIQCLKVYGGIPTTSTKIVLRAFVMERDANGKFVGMHVDNTIPLVKHRPGVCHCDCAVGDHDSVLQKDRTHPRQQEQPMKEKSSSKQRRWFWWWRRSSNNEES